MHTPYPQGPAPLHSTQADTLPPYETISLSKRKFGPAISQFSPTAFRRFTPECGICPRGRVVLEAGFSSDDLCIWSSAMVATAIDVFAESYSEDAHHLSIPAPLLHCSTSSSLSSQIHDTEYISALDMDARDQRPFPPCSASTVQRLFMPFSSLCSQFCPGSVGGRTITELSRSGSAVSIAQRQGVGGRGCVRV